MITGMSDSKLPPFPRDSKAPLDTPPAYSEQAAPAPAPAPAPRQVYTTRAPREVHTTPAPQAAYTTPAPQAAYTPPVPLAAGPSSFPSTSQGAPQQFTHAWPPAPSAPPAPPSPPPSDPYLRPADVSSYHSSSTSTLTSASKANAKGKGRSGGAKVARAVGQGMFALVALPVVAAAAAVYGSGKLVEGIGRGLSTGPEAVLRAYKKVDGKIKGAPSPDAAQAHQEGVDADADAREREWHQYQYQQQQQQRRQAEWAEAAPPMEDVKLRNVYGSLQMPKASLMEDPSIGMAGGSGSMKR
ncbi:hypothetical protein V8D89_007640 [Ganoderma adspersum]